MMTVVKQDNGGQSTELSARTEILQAEINTLKEEIDTLGGQLRDKLQMFVEAKKAAGWQEFTFFSSYYGNHSERGEGDEETTYLFHPRIKIGYWKGKEFWHGSYSYSREYISFQKWLSKIPVSELTLIDDGLRS